MKLDLAAIDGGEKVLAEKRREAKRQKTEAQKSGNQLDPVLQAELQQAQISAADACEGALEALLEACERIAAGFGLVVTGIIGRAMSVLIAQKIVVQRAHQGTRQDIRRRKREHHGLGERPKKATGHAAEP